MRTGPGRNTPGVRQGDCTPAAPSVSPPASAEPAVPVWEPRARLCSDRPEASSASGAPHTRRAISVPFHRLRKPRPPRPRPGPPSAERESGLPFESLVPRRWAHSQAHRRFPNSKGQQSDGVLTPDSPPPREVAGRSAGPGRSPLNPPQLLDMLVRPLRTMADFQRGRGARAPFEACCYFLISQNKQRGFS